MKPATLVLAIILLTTAAVGAFALLGSNSSDAPELGQEASAPQLTPTASLPSSDISAPPTPTSAAQEEAPVSAAATGEAARPAAAEPAAAVQPPSTPATASSVSVPPVVTPVGDALTSRPEEPGTSNPTTVSVAATTTGSELGPGSLPEVQINLTVAAYLASPHPINPAPAGMAPNPALSLPGSLGPAQESGAAPPSPPATPIALPPGAIEAAVGALEGVRQQVQGSNVPAVVKDLVLPGIQQAIDSIKQLDR